MLFLSPDGSKLHQPGAVRAFRCQLPWENAFYSTEVSTEVDPPEVKYSDTSLALTDPWTQKRPQIATFNELEIFVEPEAEVSN